MSVPETAWGGQWASSMENIQGMIVNYSSGIFTVRFPPAHETADIYVRWPHVLGETDWSGVRLELLPPSGSGVAGALTPRPEGRPPVTADCWDMRRAEWVRSDGSPAAAVPDTCRRQQYLARVARRRDDGCATECCWLIPRGDMDAWCWLGVDSVASLPSGVCDEDGLLDWRIENGDLFVGPLGGRDGKQRCARCNAPLFFGETRTKCCVGVEQHSGEAQWCASIIRTSATPSLA